MQTSDRIQARTSRRSSRLTPFLKKMKLLKELKGNDQNIHIKKILVQQNNNILLIQKRRARSPEILGEENNEQQNLVDQFLAV